MTRSDPDAVPDTVALGDGGAARMIERPTPSERPAFTSPSEVMIVVLTMQMQLFAIHHQMVRNFHRLALFPWRHWAGVGVAFGGERQSVIEIERDGRVGVDLKFGTITFKQEETTYAVALVDVVVSGSGPNGTRVQMEIKVAADPETDTILHVTELCRSHIIATLRAAADTVDATSARALLFEGWLPAA